MKKVSFVIIAKNEIFNIGKCIHSVKDASKLLADYEIIFIDSGSTDGTLEKVKGLPAEKLRIFQITSNPNAPRARNLGASQAHFEYIFFIDGDVVINKDFLAVALDEMIRNELIGCVSGQLEEIQYSRGFGSIVNSIPDRFGIKERLVNQWLPGGIFLARRTIFLSIHGFDERFDMNEDRDFGLRILKKYQIITLPCSMGTHHTVPYRDIYRVVLRGSLIKYMGLLIRKHIFSPKDMVMISNIEYGAFLGIGVWILILLFFLLHSLIFLFVALIILLLDIIKGIKVDRQNLLGRLIQHYFYPLLIIKGFLFFYPPKIEYNWVKINC